VDVNLNIKIDLDTMSRKIDTISQKIGMCLFLFNGGVDLTIVVDGTSLEGLERLPTHSDYNGRYFGDSREREIEDTLHWIEEAGSKHFLWIHGAAGVGKSTLARELLDHFKVEGILATFASFVMGIDSKPKVLLRMMARELWSLHPGCRPAIACAVQECSGEIQSLIEYITHFLVKPIASLAYAGPLVIIFDALDEWAYRQEFLKGLSDVDLPPNLKVIMTSRYSKDIESVVDGAARLYELTPVSNIVCRAYFEGKFQQIDWEGREPEPLKFDKLVELADGLLVWAATVCALVSRTSSKKSPIQILDDIIDSSLGRMKKMEELYRIALDRLFPEEDDDDKQPRLQTILSMITLRESLPLQDFAKLVNVRPRFVKDTCSGLRALQTRGAFNDGIVQPAIKLFHASFIDYLSHDRARNAMVNNCIHFFTHVAEPDAAELNPFPFRKGQLFVYMGKHWAGHMEEGRSEEYSTAFFEVTGDQLRLWVAWSLSRLLFLGENYQPSSLMLQTLATALCSSQGMAYSPEILLRDLSTTQAVVADFRQALDYGKIDCYDPDFYIQKQDCRSTSTNIFINCRTKWLSIDALRWAPVINGLTIGLQQIERLTSNQTGHDTAINILDNLIKINPPNLPEYPAFLDNLGLALHSRFELTRSRNDLEHAILLHMEALGAHVQDSRNYAISLGNLGRALHRRFHHFGSNPKDIEQAIVHHKHALQLLQSSDDPLRPSSLYALGNSLVQAHSLARESSDDLQEAMFLFCAITQFFRQPYVLRVYVARKGSLIEVFRTVARHMQHPAFDFRGIQLVGDQDPHILIDLEDGRVVFKILDPLLTHGTQSPYTTNNEVDDGDIDIVDLVILVGAYFRSLQVDDLQICCAGFLRFLDL
jgi:tetratricopeptide (TPR) repeat protein